MFKVKTEDLILSDNQIAPPEYLS